jgi:hypothetical protein
MSEALDACGENSSSATFLPSTKKQSTSMAPDATEEAMERLRHTIRSVHEGPSSLPTIGLYRLAMSSDTTSLPHPLISSTISSDARLLSATSEDSTVVVWNLLPREGEDPELASTSSTTTTSVHSRPNIPLRAHQKVLLGCDFGDEQEEENLDVCTPFTGNSGGIFISMSVFSFRRVRFLAILVLSTATLVPYTLRRLCRRRLCPRRPRLGRAATCSRAGRTRRSGFGMWRR